MRIKVIGGGPGGLYFALLTKKAKPRWDIEVIEQNRDDDTFGFGVVFSDDTLDEFLSHDHPSYDRTLLLLGRKGAVLVPVPLEGDGIDMEAFERALVDGPV